MNLLLKRVNECRPTRATSCFRRFVIRQILKQRDAKSTRRALAARALFPSNRDPATANFTALTAPKHRLALKSQETKLFSDRRPGRRSHRIPRGSVLLFQEWKWGNRVERAASCPGIEWSGRGVGERESSGGGPRVWGEESEDWMKTHNNK